ncbi:exportin, tRNA (nuclear export receptor for tRNAs) (predicted), isoform CRA_c [Rattus norvegicus]|uniref:Exportin, tRNA (Nuclear export receptor for tRNAs) (Predicted), isoform CRA_c n=1 Tax=Rattus norvegicus TaxID=10116 RepID=A6IH03_RAT|nr:exportin, tRNA (nuclear export receptor for tRNAs) (predicted), isoform CRA_c [Rattus norvegicus]
MCSVSSARIPALLASRSRNNSGVLSSTSAA